MRAVIAVAACALVLPGCGGSAEGGAKRSGRLVDFSQKPPYGNALDIDPATGDFLMTTNRGFFRIDARTHAVARVRATVTASSQSAGVGTFLDILSTGPGRVLGSGHPDVKGQVPPYLGLIASADGGRSWRSVSKLGESDFHKIVARDGRLYAFDAVLGAMLISSDGGRSFVERFTPPGLIIDFEVDPGDADHLVAATDARLVRSTDGGKRWRPIDTGQGIRSERVGRVPGEPYTFKALGPERLDLALSDGTIVATQDGGRHWKETFRP